MQAFKERYGIQLDGSYEDGIRDVTACDRIFAGFMMGLCEGKQGFYVLCYNFAMYKCHHLDSHEGFSICMRCFFYSLQASQPNFASIRAGVQILGDFEGLGWNNFSIEGEKRAAQLYSNCYPMRLTAMAVMNANVLIRMFYNVLKLVLPKKVRKVISLPPKRDAYLKNLDNLDKHALPADWGGTQTREGVIQAFGANLGERYANAAKFEL